MLAKMGYQKGQGLGKNKEGRSEPIGLVIRGHRTGLGVEEERKRRRDASAENQAVRASKRQQLTEVLQKDFAEQQASKLADRRYEGQLKSARQVIETLDIRKGFERSFLWPIPEASEGEDAEEAELQEQDTETAKEPTWEDQPTKEKLITALTYLRNHHSYCIHCGHQYDDPGDLEQNCPGLMDDDH